MKKRIVLICILALFVCSNGFSYEAWLSTGFEYSNFFEKSTVNNHPISSNIGSPGFGIASFQFWEDFGFLINISILFPKNVSMGNEEYEYNLQLAYIIGPAFRINFTENTKIALGIGFSSIQTFGDLLNDSLFNLNFGLGGDVGLVYIVNRLVYINLGTMVNYQFVNRTRLQIGNEEITDWSKNYDMFGIRPYIRIGFMIKPKE